MKWKRGVKSIGVAVARGAHRVGDGRVIAQPEQRDVLRRRELDVARVARRERVVGPEPVQLIGLGPVGDRLAARDLADEEPRREPLRRDLGRGPVREVHERVGVARRRPASSFASRARPRAARPRTGRRARRRSRRDRCGRRGTPTRRRGTRASTSAGRAAPRARRRRRGRARRSRRARAATPDGFASRRHRPRSRSLLGSDISRATRSRARPFRAGRAAPSCRTCRRSSSAPRR